MPPPLAVEVDRPALDLLLDEASLHPVTVVSAGPGWGKTTAVAGWVRRRQDEVSQAVAWLTLEPVDDSPAAFWGSILRAIALSGAVPHGHPLASASTSAGAGEEVLAALFRGLDSLPAPLLIVLDDFHLIEDTAVIQAVADLVSYDTPVRLMLLTRFDPPLPLHRLRVGGRLAEVRAGDLRFDTATVTGLATGTELLDLTGSEAEQILARTDGWAAGVRLATLHLARQGADRDLGGFTGTQGSVAEYLVAEVLERHSPDTRVFLTRTSVVDRLSADLADAIVPGGNGLARLEWLEQANQFVVSLDEGRTTYRYHPLLRDLLLHRLRRDDPTGYLAAHRAAASWLAEHGEPLRALGHAIAAEDWQLVTAVYFAASPSLAGSQRETLRHELRAIPYGTQDASSSLELCAAGLDFADGHLGAMEARVRQARHLVAAGDVLPPLGAALLEILAGVAARRLGDLPTVVASATEALGYLDKSLPGPGTEGLRTIAITQRAVGQLWRGDVASARDAFTMMVHQRRPGDVALTVISARANQAWCALAMGRLDDAETMARAALDDAALRGWTSLLQLRPAHLTVGTLDALRGNLDDADRAVAAGLAAQVGGVELWPTVALRLLQATVAVSRTRPRAAISAMAQARAARGDQPVAPAVADSTIRTATDIAVLTGELDDALAETRTGWGPEPRSATSWASQARIALARGDLEAAQVAAERVPRSSDSDDLADVVAAIEALTVLALVADQRQLHVQALDCIRHAVDLARPQRLTRPLLVIGAERGTRLLRRLAAVDHETDRFVRTVIGAKSQDMSRPEPEPLLDPLTERELAVLAELATMKSNAEIAVGFYVSVNTVKAHVKNLFRKLDVSNRRSAVRRGRELRLIA